MQHTIVMDERDTDLTNVLDISLADSYYDMVDIIEKNMEDSKISQNRDQIISRCLEKRDWEGELKAEIERMGSLLYRDPDISRCNCEDECCPHKSSISGLALSIISGKINTHDFYLEKYDFEKLQIIKINDSSVVNFFPGLNRFSEKIKCNAGESIPLRRCYGDFIEAIVFEDDVNESTPIDFTINTFPFCNFPIRADKSYFFFGMCPIYSAIFTEQSIRFDKDIEINLIYHSIGQKVKKCDDLLIKWGNFYWVTMSGILTLYDKLDPDLIKKFNNN
jgi:hypothetical protein